MSEKKIAVGIVMGSDSDWPTMQAAAVMLKDFGVPSKPASFPPTAPPTCCSNTPKPPVRVA
jgi:hypothetical protein